MRPEAESRDDDRRRSVCDREGHLYRPMETRDFRDRDPHTHEVTHVYCARCAHTLTLQDPDEP